MKLSRTWVGLLVASMLVLATLGCATGAARKNDAPSEKSLRTFERQRSEARMLVVTTRYEIAYGNAPRLLAEPTIVRWARAPFLIDSPGLAGRAELLDSKGRVLYSIGYRPLSFQPPPGKAMLSTEGPTLRLPWLKRATRLRLTEEERELVVEVPLSGAH